MPADGHQMACVRREYDGYFWLRTFVCTDSSTCDWRIVIGSSSHSWQKMYLLVPCCCHTLAIIMANAQSEVSMIVPLHSRRPTPLPPSTDTQHRPSLHSHRPSILNLPTIHCPSILNRIMYVLSTEEFLKLTLTHLFPFFIWTRMAVIAGYSSVLLRLID